MNLVGFSVAVKGVNDNFKSLGRGGRYSDGPSGPSQKDYFYADCKDIITECAKMPTMAGKLIPFETEHKEPVPYSRKKKKVKEEHTIFISDVNSDGLKLDNVSFDTSDYSVIGMIDNDKIFGLNAKTGQLDVMEIEATFSCGPHGDHDLDYSIIKYPLYKWDYLSVKTRIVKSADEIESERYGINNVPEEEAKLKSVLDLVNHIGGKKAKFIKAESEAESQGMGL